ncbi:MAG TPA: 16S rRNA processing protein RimM [Clostridiales bacterium]|nr:16S rRNA processing protein RimM [Clostridiales bacterium]
MTEYFELGKIVKPQGIRGEVKVEAYTDDLGRFCGLDFVFFKEGGGYVKHALAGARVDAKAAYLQFDGVADRDAAEALRGTTIYIDRENAAKLPPGAYYISDLLGMAVLDDGGNELGSLKDIIQTGSKDVYVVSLINGGTLLFPSVEGIYQKRDVQAGVMVLNREKLSEVAVYDV